MILAKIYGVVVWMFGSGDLSYGVCLIGGQSKRQLFSDS